MRYILIISNLIFIFLSSCKKENDAYFNNDNGLVTINIDSLKHSYISENNDYYYNSLFKSKSDIQEYNLKLQKNRKYRISSSQAFSETSSIQLALLSGNDTITVSQNLNGQQVLYFNSSINQTLILQAKLTNNYNISLDYNLYFEELSNNLNLRLNEKTFTYYGHFSDVDADTSYFYPSKSYWYKWLKIDQDFSSVSKISFDLLSSTENKYQEIGFIIGGSPQLSGGGSFQNNLPNGIFFSLKQNQYFITQISESSSTLLDSGNLQTAIDYNQTINIRVQQDVSYHNIKYVYINNELTAIIECPDFEEFYTVFSDRYHKNIKIFNYHIN